MKQVIALLGRTRNGKSTAARYLRENHGFRVIGFATPLREMAKRFLGFTDEQMYGDANVKDVVDPDIGMSPRDALITLGDNLRALLGHDVLIRACFEKIARTGHPLWVIEDTRSPDEAEAVINSLEFEGHVVKLSYIDAEDTSCGHETESAVDEVPARLISRLIRHTKSYQAQDLLAQIDNFLQEAITMWEDEEDYGYDEDDDEYEYDEEEVLDVFDELDMYDDSMYYDEDEDED